MENLKILLLAITQGVSELIPVSSSAHLILLGRLINIPVSTLMLTTLQIGTSIAIIVFFRHELFDNFFSKRKLNLYLKMLISIIPIGVIGILYEHKVEEVLRFNWIIAVSLIFWGIVMILVDLFKKNTPQKKIENITLKNSIIIGLSQILALIPGTSRSGIAILAGIATGFDKYSALEYSLILGVPILIGSSLWEIIRSVFIQNNDFSYYSDPSSFIKLGIIFIVPFIVGSLSLIVLSKIKKEKWLLTFGIYRIVLGVLILLFL